MNLVQGTAIYKVARQRSHKIRVYGILWQAYVHQLS